MNYEERKQELIKQAQQLEQQRQQIAVSIERIIGQVQLLEELTAKPEEVNDGGQE